jgi:WD40 repeat protein/serine/threonine protein kinase
MNPCPSRERLERFLGQEAGPEDGALAAHVEDCPACQAVLEDLLRSLPGLAPRPAAAPPAPRPADDFVGRLKQAPPPFLHGDAGPATEPDPGPAPFAGPPAPDAPLGRLGAYHLLEALGSGATGQVFKAYDADLDRLVAIKVLKPELAADDAGRAAFEREARAAAAVRHEHVVTIHQVGRVPGADLPYLVMEHVDGEPLGGRLRRLGPLPAAEAARLVRQAALGLAHAHRRGLVHRDIKPANLLVEAATGRVKITDFGLACAAAPTPDGPRVRAGAVVGTPAYMSPEQILTPAHVDGRSDIYSLGVVLYELLLGEPPFRGPAPRALRHATRTPPVPPRLCDPAVPPGLEQVVLTCLAKEPGRRYQTADDLAADLDRWLAGEAVRARPAGPLARLGRWCRQHPALLLAVLGPWSLVLGLSWSLIARDQELGTRDEGLRTRDLQGQRLLARLALDRGQALGEQGEVGRGMLWFARALELAPDDELRITARLQLAAWRRQLHVLHSVLPHEGPVYAVAFSPDGRALLTGCAGDNARLWDAASGKLLAASPSQTVPVTDAQFSPDGSAILMRRQSSPAALWFTGAEGRRVEFIGSGEENPTAVAFSPDGRTVLTTGGDQAARLWEAATGRLLRRLFRPPSGVAALAFTPDGRAVLAGGKDGTVRRWHVADGTPVGPPLTHPGPLTDLAVRPDGRAVLTGGKDHTARLWDLETGEPLGPPLRHRDKVYAVAFGPDGQTVLTGGKDRTARLWEGETGRPLGPPLPHPGTVNDVAVSPDGRTVLTGSEDGSARLWRVARPAAAERDLGHGSPVTALAFAPDGRTLLVGTDNGEVCRLDADGTAVRDQFWRGRALGALAFSPDGRTVLLGSQDRSAWLLRADTGEVLGLPLLHQERVYGVAFSPDGRTALTGGEDRVARLWDAATGRPLGTFGPHAGAVLAVAFSPDGHTVVTGSWDGAVRFWETATFRPVGAGLHHGGAVTAVAFRPDGRTLLTASRDSTAQLWDVATRRPLEQPLPHDQPVRCAAFSPDGRTILTGGEDRTARWWDAATGLPLGPPLRLPAVVHALAFAPDGRLAVLAGERGTARVWDVPRPVEGPAEQVVRWVQVVTGLELDADEQVRALDGRAWQERRRRLQDGPAQPLP